MQDNQYHMEKVDNCCSVLPERGALENVQVASYLGVQIAGNLTWHNHVAKVATNGNKMLGFVRCIIRTSTKSTKTLAYQTLVRPTLEYSSCIWSPYQTFLREDLEKVQRRAVRYVCAIYVGSP